MADGGCPTPDLGYPMPRMDAERAADLLKALADPSRIQLLSVIARTEEGAACVCDLTGVLGLSQATVSHHLKILVESGILRMEKRGYWNWYLLEQDQLEAIAALVSRGNLSSPAVH